MKYFLIFIIFVSVIFSELGLSLAEINLEDVPEVEKSYAGSGDASTTDSETVIREEESIKLDGLSVAQQKEIREKAEKFTFQTEVNRMMKLIINSLYRNKEIFLRELISNASDAIDKIRLLSLTNRDVLDTKPEFEIKIKADKDNKVLHITDSGIGMTKSDLINNLGTIAKSGTAEFLSKMKDQSDNQDLNDMIGQFGVGFYSAFLVADKVVVTTKNNDDKQYIWESTSNSYSIVEDPRGDTLKRGTTISLYMKNESQDFLEEDTVKQLIKKYSQFINFPIYMWSSKTIEEDEPEEAVDTSETKTEDNIEDEGKVEEETSETESKKKKKITKTVWDWEIINESKPIWTKKPADVTEDEYKEFYKSLTKDTNEPLTHSHFVAEGEVSFKSLIYIPKVQPSESFNRYGTKADHIKLYVRRVFITDEFNDMMPNYLRFILGVVDSDDLPLNVSRETLQQHKLIKVIKKKLVRKALDMLKKLDKTEYESFWKEYSTNIKLGIMEDPTNRSRLSKLLRFHSSKDDGIVSLTDYVSRMKTGQEFIYYIAGPSKTEVATSPFVERLLDKGYEVLYLVEAVDEYCISALPEFEGKRFQNVAKEGFKLGQKSSKKLDEYKQIFEPLTKWLNDVALKNEITKAEISQRLKDSPCALVANMFGWTGNMERLALSNAHQKTDDPQRLYYLNQKKTLEINPRHPLIKELLRRVTMDANDSKAIDTAKMLFRTATLRSGFMLKETLEFASSIEHMMKETLGLETETDEWEQEDDDEEDGEEESTDESANNAEDNEEPSEHDEL